MTHRIGKRSAYGLLAWLLALGQIATLSGCRQEGSGRTDGSGAGGTAVAGATSGPDLGIIVYETLRGNLKKNGTAAQITALEGHKQPFVDAVNRVLPTNAASNVWSTIRKFLPLVDDDTIPNGVADVRGILADLAGDASVCQALADISANKGATGTVDQGDMTRMISRLLAYQDFDNLARSTSDFIKTNPSLIDSVLGIVSRQLQKVTPATFQSSTPVAGMADLAAELLRPADMGGFANVGAPAWTALLDKNGNPAVATDPAGRVLPPFADDGKGTAKIDAQGRPVNALGGLVTTKPFGTDGSRDSYGRALAGGQPLFKFVDVKRTTLGQLLILTGEALKKQLPSDIFFLLDHMIDRVKKVDQNGATYEVFQPGNAVCDAIWAQMELVRRTPMPQILSGVSELYRNDPAKFEDMVTSLLIALDKAKKSGFSAVGQQSMIDDLIPLLHAACSANGRSVTAVRALLQAFNTAQSQLRDLPKGFARMMKFHDYGKLIPTGKGQPSVMERLLGVMKRSDSCSPPFLGNLAELYIDTMAGNNKSILGIKLDIHSMNNLMKIGILRKLLCGPLNADDAQCLQDFADTGALDAFIPIAKAFSDRKETRLLVDIMLKMGDHYAQAMQPNEPAVVKLLESGAVEKLFDALNRMTTVKVPATNEVVADVLADMVAAMVDNSKPLYDRKGHSYPTLLHLVKAPLDALCDLATRRGEKARWERVVTNAMDTFLAIYTDKATGKEKVRACGLIHSLGEIMAFMSKQIPADPAQRSTWCDAKVSDFQTMMSERDVIAIVDIVKQIKSSPQAKVFDDAVANLLTPAQQVNQDALGSIAVLAANILQAHPQNTQASPTNGKALATAANFFGRELDPAAGKVKRLLTMIQRIIEADDGLLLLQIARNAFDMGPNGNLEAPITEIQATLGDIDKAAPASSGPKTGASISSDLKKTIDFLDDAGDGLTGIFNRIKARSR